MIRAKNVVELNPKFVESLMQRSTDIKILRQMIDFGQDRLNTFNAHSEKIEDLVKDHKPIK